MRHPPVRCSAQHASAAMLGRVVLNFRLKRLWISLAFLRDSADQLHPRSQTLLQEPHKTAQGVI